MAQLGCNGGAEAAVDISDENGVPVVAIVGELDISNVDALRTYLEPVVEREPRRLVFDLSEVEFMDSSAIALLLQAADRVAEIVVRDPTRIVRRLIATTGLSDVLPIEP
jgi:anti-sigma B factor antagonist